MHPEAPNPHHLFLRAYTAHEPALRAFVRRLVPQRSDADDVLQDIAVVLWEKFSTFDPSTDFRAWAFQVARYEVLAWIRDRNRDRLVLDEDVVLTLAEESAAEDRHLQDQREALNSCMQKIPEKNRHLILHAYSGVTSTEALAGQSGRSVAGFYQWLHRMRRLLLDCIQKSVPRSHAGTHGPKTASA
jgi:RNA polymerase sigma-70 factor (ECF subfamily)